MPDPLLSREDFIHESKSSSCSSVHPTLYPLLLCPISQNDNGTYYTKTASKSKVKNLKVTKHTACLVKGLPPPRQRCQSYCCHNSPVCGGKQAATLTIHLTVLTWHRLTFGYSLSYEKNFLESIFIGKSTFLEG